MDRPAANLLDIRTLIISEILIISVASLVLLLFWKYHRRKFPGIGYWAAASFLQTVAFLFTALRDIAPGLVSIPGANIFLLFSTALMYTGIETFQGAKKNRAFPFVIAGAASIVQLYFSFFMPDLTWRIHVLSFFSLVMLAFCIKRFLTPKQKSVWPVIVPVTSLGLFAAIAVYRIFVTIFYPPGTSLMQSGVFQAVSIMGYIAGTTGWVTGLILVISWKLKVEEEGLANTNRMLIREMHHRIKNNLATLRGMLYIQAAISDSAELKSALTKSCNRIDAIAKIHDLLHLSEDVRKASLRAYLEYLIRSVEESCAKQGVRVELDVEDLSLSINTLIPLGLIINELVTNSFEHAFKDGRKGKITVSFHPSETGYSLKVSDDGTGFTATTDNIAEFSSLGLKIVDSLSKQLNGRLSIRTEPATVVEVDFGMEKSEGS